MYDGLREMTSVISWREGIKNNIFVVMVTSPPNTCALVVPCCSMSMLHALPALHPAATQVGGSLSWPSKVRHCAGHTVRRHETFTTLLKK
jgi:hypothetical protein